ncbi:BON domain-containing protein [Albitalea terrae]|uniref:BON domain-containing protein n=2 Tax=Piscinibacter terrae TaxID=2496871 RepID=A0A3N7IRD2_9BURK|nr:BON domain-containing protein [Albitalea terrae]
MHGLYERRRYGLGASELVFTQARPARAARRKFRQAIARNLGPALLVMAVALGSVVIVQLVQPVSAQTATGARTLSAEGFPDVRLIAGDGGAMQLSGYVDDPKALARLQRWLQKSPGLGTARVQVRVGTELAARVQEALSDAALTVDYTGGGTVRIQGSSESTALRDQLHRLTLDLAGVVKVDNRVAFIEPAEAAPREHVLPVRIVDVVPGENGSFSNGSGARYFVGGVLPDGAEVVAIRKDGIEFSVAGRAVIYPLK